MAKTTKTKKTPKTKACFACGKRRPIDRIYGADSECPGWWDGLCRECHIEYIGWDPEE